MCGRYYIELDSSEFGKEIIKKCEKSFQDTKYKEVFPGQEAIVLIRDNDSYAVKVMKWGFEGKSLVINARSETLHERRMFQPFVNQRCLVVSNGFFEWSKPPYKKKIKISWEENIMLLAGIYNNKNEFVIVTGESIGDMAHVHHRTPILVHETDLMKFLKHEMKYEVKKENLKFEILE